MELSASLKMSQATLLRRRRLLLAARKRSRTGQNRERKQVGLPFTQLLTHSGGSVRDVSEDRE